MESQFVVAWCNEGLETILPITEWEREAIMNILSNTPYHKKNVNQQIGMLMMRARFNTQRHYEIYAITAVDGITEEDIREMFDNAPQVAADTMRRIGVKIFSDRADPNRFKIT